VRHRGDDTDEISKWPNLFYLNIELTCDLLAVNCSDKRWPTPRQSHPLSRLSGPQEQWGGGGGGQNRVRFWYGNNYK
jgi:hypothetical protein